MAFATKLGLGARHALLSSSALGLRQSNTRLFSSLIRNNSIASRGIPRGAFVPRYLSTSSTAASTAASTLPSSSVNEPATASLTPDVISQASETTTDTLTTLASQLSIPPLQYGDLSALGLTGWSPAGLVRWSLEVINVTTQIPWFWTIIAGTVFWRLFCLPFTIVSLRESALLQPHQKKFTELREKQQAAMKESTMALTKANAELAQFQREKGLNPIRGVYGLVQLPVTLGLFFGIREMANLPVQQLKESGVAFLPDLTMPDPTWIMPAALLAIVNAQISAGAKDLNLVERPVMGHVMNLFRGLSLAGFWVMTDFSAALMLSLLTTSSFTLVQTVLLQRPMIRALFGIPIVPKDQQGKMPTMLESLREARNYIQGARSAAVAGQKQQVFESRKYVPPPVLKRK